MITVLTVRIHISLTFSLTHLPDPPKAVPTSASLGGRALLVSEKHPTFSRSDSPGLCPCPEATWNYSTCGWRGRRCGPAGEGAGAVLSYILEAGALT